MFYTTIAVISVALSILSGLSYVTATLRGEAKPNRVTWLLWSVAPMIGGFAQLASGVGLSTAVIFASSVMPLCVFLASFKNRNAYWKLETFDYGCGVFSLMAVLLWAITANPVVAIVFSLLSDILAAVPTIRKFVTHPETEDRRSYVLAAAGNLIGLLSIREYSFESVAFNAYLALMTVSFLPLLFRRELSRLRA